MMRTPEEVDALIGYYAAIAQAENAEEDRLFDIWFADHPKEKVPEYYEERMMAEVSGAVERPVWMLNQVGEATVSYYIEVGIERWKKSGTA